MFISITEAIENPSIFPYERWKDLMFATGISFDPKNIKPSYWLDYCGWDKWGGVVFSAYPVALPFGEGQFHKLGTVKAQVRRILRNAKR